ncbi:MAG: AAA family ATPase [Flavobacterium sp.]|nr:AAA family ATPase [Flavobacterium sp.]
MKVICRIKEKELLTQIKEDKKPSFLAVYGPRRVGKTFLIKEYFNNKFTFYTTGIANSNTKAQLINFSIALNQSLGKEQEVPKNWIEAFLQLKKLLEKTKGKKTLFIDELPWFDTKKSNFISGLEWFWNSWASSQENITLIVCGSSASWMINKLIANRGGLHNRVTNRMKIEPFTLAETEQFLESKNIKLDRYQIANLYMVMGGIPYYLEQISKGMSATQNIEKICFEQDGLLKNEFNYIFSSLFNQAEMHEKIIRNIFILGARATREQLLKQLNTTSSGELSKKIRELEESGFIKSYIPFGANKTKLIYVISDYYTLFFLKFIENSKNINWLEKSSNAEVVSWNGLAFEQLCWDHISNIKKALGIAGIYSETSVWNKKGDAQNKGAQIDLIVDRKDRIINLFEIKFSINEYEITKSYDASLRNKIDAFKKFTKTKKTIFLTMITTFGLIKNQYYGSVASNEITLNDLFID